ncbi:MAG: hypothetical protein R3F37_21920 [Candidatus Competibacteraceae bacterium]
MDSWVILAIGCLLASTADFAVSDIGMDSWTAVVTGLLTLSTSLFVSEAGRVMTGFLLSATVFLDIPVILVIAIRDYSGLDLGIGYQVLGRHLEL